MKYRYHITWRYKDEIELHSTFVECNRRKLSLAEIAFDKFFRKTLHSFCPVDYCIIACDYVGSVIKKTW